MMFLKNTILTLGRTAGLTLFFSAMWSMVLLLSASNPTSVHASTFADNTTTSNVVSSFLQAQSLERSGNFDAAARAYGHALSRQPNNPSLLKKTFTTMLLSGRHQEASQLATRYINIIANDESLLSSLTSHPDRASAIQQAAYIRMTEAIKQADYATVIQMATPVQEWLGQRAASSMDARIHHALHTILLAWSHLAQNNQPRAQELLDELMLGEPFLFYQDALMNYRTNQLNQATAAYSALHSEDHPLIIMLGIQLYTALNQPEKAAQLRQNFTTKNADIHLTPAEYPDLQQLSTADFTRTIVADIYHQISSLFVQQNLLNDALFFLQLANFLQPNHAYSHYALGELSQKNGWHQQALKHFQAITADSGFYLRAQAKQAAMHYQLGQKDIAKTQLMSLIEQNPQQIFATLTLADILLKEENYDHAIRAYTTALAEMYHQNSTLERASWSILYARGIAFEQADNWPKAEQDFMAALALYPDQPDVLNYLGYSWLVKSHKVEQAELMLKKAILQRPRDGHILDSYGWALFLMGEHVRAIPFLERASSLLPEQAVINDHLGDLYWHLGRRLEARFQWQRALRGEDIPDLNREATEQKLKTGLPNQHSSTNQP